MARILRKEREEYSKNSAKGTGGLLLKSTKGARGVWQKYSRMSMARIVLRGQELYGKNNAKGAVRTMQE